MIKCICVNDTNCPIDFPLPSQWIVKDQEYHIIDVKYVVRSESLAYKLYEKQDERLWPYTFFKSDRFALDKLGVQQVLQMIEGTYEPETIEKIKEKILEDGVSI